MVLAVVIVLMVVGSIVFHFASPWWFTPLAADWGSIDFTINVTFWITGVVFVAINLFMAYCIYKFRAREGHKAVYEPENSKLEMRLSVITSIGVVAMLAPGLFVWAVFVTPPEDAAEIEVIAQQWQWSYRYPGIDGQLGTVDNKYVSESNPFGMNPDDPNGQDDVLVEGTQMHLPLGQATKFLLRSKDVLHNYTVAQFRVKMDMVPGLVSTLWLEPTLIGEYDILCEELCGIGHHIMRGSVVIEEQEDYDAWIAAQPTFAEMNAQAPANLTAGQQSFALCATCHGQQGEGNPAMNAPKISGQQTWYLERQLTYYKNGIRGAHEDDTYGKLMAPMAASLTTEESVRNVSAYIASLVDTPAPQTVTGDVANGKRIYNSNCAACHLKDGSGTWFTDAPVLAGASDWYMVTQLNNFRAGIRGLHPRDAYGEQMVSMATAVPTQQSLEDVISYINTLR